LFKSSGRLRAPGGDSFEVTGRCGREWGDRRRGKRGVRPAVCSGLVRLRLACLGSAAAPLLKVWVADRGARLSGRRSATEVRGLASATHRAAVTPAKSPADSGWREPWPRGHAGPLLVCVPWARPCDPARTSRPSGSRVPEQPSTSWAPGRVFLGERLADLGAARTGRRAGSSNGPGWRNQHEVGDEGPRGLQAAGLGDVSAASAGGARGARASAPPRLVRRSRPRAPA